MKVTKQEYDAILAANTDETLGFAVLMQTGNSEAAGQQITDYYIVDNGPVHEIGVMTGRMVSLLKANNRITEQEHGLFRVLWRKIIKS